MQIAVKRSEFLRVLDRVRWTAAGKGPQALLSCFCFKDGLVTAYNGQAGTVTSCPLNGAAFAVDATQFYRLISSLFEDIQLDVTESRLNIKSGSNKTWMSIHDVRAYPEVFPANYTEFYAGTDLTAALSSVYMSIGHNVLKPQLMGTAIVGDSVYTSDSYRITRHKLAGKVSQHAQIPALATAHMVRLGTPTKYFVGDGLFGCMFLDTKTTYITRLLEAEFPTVAVDGMLPAPGPMSIPLPLEIAGMVQRIQAAAPEEEPDIIIEWDGSNLIVRTQAYTARAAGGKEVMAWQPPQLGEGTFRVCIKSSFFLAAYSKSQTIDFSTILNNPNARQMRFVGQNFDHLMSLMIMQEGE